MLFEFSLRAEIQAIQQTWLYKAFIDTFSYTSNKVIMVFVLFTILVSNGEALIPESIFLSLAFFDIIRWSLTTYFPLGIQFVSEVLISIHRIEQFLKLEEKGNWL